VFYITSTLQHEVAISKRKFATKNTKRHKTFLQQNRPLPWGERLGEEKRGTLSLSPKGEGICGWMLRGDGEGKVLQV
jgi:hypothetical protein